MNEATIAKNIVNTKKKVPVVKVMEKVVEFEKCKIVRTLSELDESKHLRTFITQYLAIHYGIFF